MDKQILKDYIDACAQVKETKAVETSQGQEAAGTGCGERILA